MEKTNIPKETETIAAKRAVRLAKRFRKAHQKLLVEKSWWGTWSAEILIIISLVGLNSYLVYERFGSVALETPFSGPIVPFFAKLLQITGQSFLERIQIVNIVFFIFFPATYYMFIRSVTSRKLAAVIATLIVILPVYPFAQTRIMASLDTHDGAHIASLTLIPLALLGLHGFVRKGGIGNLIIASVFTMLVALTSPFGLLTYLIFVSILTFSEMLLGKGRLKVSRLLSVLLFGAGLSSFWYNPSFLVWLVVGPLGQDVRITVSKLIPISFFALPILGTFGYLLFDRKPQLQSVFLASFYTIAFFIISSAGGGVFPSHPSRYVAELGLAIAFLISIIIVRITDYIKLSDVQKIIRFRRFSFNVVSINKGLSKSLLVSIVFLLVVGVIIGKDSVSKESNVLGTWTEVEKGEIWVAKDRFDGYPSVVGYAITGVSVGALGMVRRQSKKENNDFNKEKK